MNKQELSSYKKNLKFVFKITFLVILLTFAASLNFVPRENILSFEINSLFLAFLFMFVVPIFFLKKIQKKDISSFGWRMPVNIKEAIIYIVFSFLIIFPTAFIFSGSSLFHNFYISKGLSSENFIIVAVIIPLFYFFFEEFFIRGFFFFSLFKKIGIHAFWVVSIVFAFLHVTQPIPEIIFSFFAGLLFCFLSYKTKSFLPAFVVHFLISVLTMGLIVFA
jgi:membrane protease YdiL (CAAX protease family)